MFFATRCPGCGRTGPAPCPACVAEMERAPPLSVPRGLDACRSFLAYDDGPAREVITQLKYRNVRATLGWLADGVADLYDPAAVDVVTWAPTTVQRRRQRGFDQAELLARAVARRMGRPSRALLRRRPGPHQTGRPLAQRRCGPVFVAAHGTGAARSPPGPVLLVDDVITSGTTISAAARALRRPGAGGVLGATAARRP